jgi:hypothetical protein
MQPVYFSHGYRDREREFNAHFEQLLRQSELLPNVDPPSSDVNAAKLEKNLSYNKGLIAVLTDREGDCSPYMLYEISMCVRAGKPLLVFLEDTLPSNVMPARVPQARFSSKSYFRQVRHHVHCLEIFKSYLGSEYEPDFMMLRARKNCIVIGAQSLSPMLRKSTEAVLAAQGYDLSYIKTGKLRIPQTLAEMLEFLTAYLVLVFIDCNSAELAYILGLLQRAIVPTLALTFRSDWRSVERIPAEFQPRLIPDDECGFRQSLQKQVELFEQDFVDINSDREGRAYADQLAAAAFSPGKYSDQFRGIVIQEMKMTQGDSYNVSGQAVNVGPQGTATTVSQHQVRTSGLGSIDLAALARELGELRSTLRKDATTAEQDASVGAVAEAEQAAAKGDEQSTLQALKRAGSWALDRAGAVGVVVAAAALRKALGLP